jgi:hypothetical protein
VVKKQDLSYIKKKKKRRRRKKRVHSVVENYPRFLAPFAATLTLSPHADGRTKSSLGVRGILGAIVCIGDSINFRFSTDLLSQHFKKRKSAGMSRLSLFPLFLYRSITPRVRINRRQS